MAETPSTEIPVPAPQPPERPLPDGGEPSGAAPARSGGGGRRPRKGRRVAKWLLLLLLLPVALVVLVLAFVYAALHTGVGQRYAARLASAKVTELLQGKLRVGKVELKGGLDLCLRDVSLDDPETGPVISAESACVSLVALALPKQHLVARSVVVEHPVLDVATVAGKDGKPTTTLSRALAARVEQPKTPGGPLAWVIEVHELDLRRGEVRLRPAPGKPPSFSLGAIDLEQAQVRYAEEGALAKLGLTARLLAPGKLPLQLRLDAVLEGTTSAGRLTLHALELTAGQSGLTASGHLDVGTLAGEVQLAALHLRPEDLAALTKDGSSPLAAEVHGKGEVQSDGHKARVRLQLQSGKARVELEASSSFDAVPAWSVKVQAQGVDPRALSAKAPRGEVALTLDAHGKGVPGYDEAGPQGDLEGKLHVGPAQLAGMGKVAVDLDARLSGHRGMVRAFTATALGLKLAAHGRAARDAVDLAVDLDAPDLYQVARAISVLTKKPAANLEGAAHLVARVHGRPLRPDAEVHLRSPRLQAGDALDVAQLAIDGELHGDLVNPDEVPPTGALTVKAGNAAVGSIELGSPTLRADVRWPGANVDLVAQVLGGQMHFLGQAALDSDGDGLVVPQLTLSYPGNELKLRQPIAVHFRPRSTVIEPFWLEGQHGGLGASATIHKPAKKGGATDLDALVQLRQLDLAHLPQFALPPDLGLAGLLTGRIVVDGKLPHPTVDAHLDLAGGALKRVRGVDLKLYAHLIRDRLRAEAEGSGPAGVHVSLKADAPLGSPKLLSLAAPLNGEVVLRDLDLEKAAEIAGDPRLAELGLRGKLTARAEFQGTLGAPTLAGSVHLQHLGATLPKKAAAAAPAAPARAGPAPGPPRAKTQLGGVFNGARLPPRPAAPGARIDDADVDVGLRLDHGMARVDGHVSAGAVRAVDFLVETPFELAKGIRDPSYLGGMMDRKLRARVVVEDADLKKAAALGVLPAGTEGLVGAVVQLDGTAREPLLSVEATAKEVVTGKLRDLGGQVKLAAGKQITVNAQASLGADPLAVLDLTLDVSAKEWAELSRIKDPKQVARRIADRALKGELRVPGISVERVASLFGSERAIANGTLAGAVSLSGTPGEPEIVGKLTAQDLTTKNQKAGRAEVFVEGGPTGATLHVGFSPPGGGTLLAHADLKADLTAKALLEKGAAGLRQGELDGRVTAKDFDLGLLGGNLPLLRRAAGRLNGDVQAKGLLSHLHSSGKASLRGGLFDVVGQGIFHEVAFDASFTPKEMVLDRLTGQLESGSFAAILVANERPAPGTDDGSTRLEFTGEVHLGDDESVRELTDAKGKPRGRGPLPVRLAATPIALIGGEVDLFGSYDRGLLTVNTKIPDANVTILGRPTKKLQSLKPDADVLLVHPGEAPHPPGMEPDEVEAEKRARKTANFRLQLALQVDHLFVKDPQFEFPVQANLNFEYDARRPDKPTADGTIKVPNGSFTALGRRFQVESALITETGGDLVDPELEVKARYEKGSTVVFISVGGTAKDPTIDLTSNPPMDQDAIAFFLATGRVQGRATQNGGGVDLSTAASSIAGSLVFGEVQKQLQGALPLDVLVIEANGTSVAQASFGKYVGDSIFIGYRQRLTPAPNENTSEGRIEYEVSRSVTAEGTVGDRNSDVSILWTKDF